MLIVFERTTSNNSAKLAKRAKLTLSRVQLRFQIYIYRYVCIRQKYFARASNYVS